jgi:hypothetical protein
MKRIYADSLYKDFIYKQYHFSVNNKSADIPTPQLTDITLRHIDAAVTKSRSGHCQ